MSHNEHIEQIASKVHNAWWQTKIDQGYHAPIDCKHKKPAPAVGYEEAHEAAFTKHCDWCHPDMYAYADLPEKVKDYDRTTVQAVLKAITELDTSNQIPVIAELLDERARQDAKWGIQDHHPFEWLAILGEEKGEADKAALETHFGNGDDEYSAYRHELIQVASVAIAAIECLDRKNRHYPQK